MKEILSNQFRVDLSEYANFSSNDGPIQGPVIFKYLARVYNLNDFFENMIYDIGAYVNFTKEDYIEKSKLIVKYLHNDMFINQYPKRNPFNINRFITKFAIKIQDLQLYNEEINKALIAENIKNTEQAKYYIHAILYILNELYLYTKDKNEYDSCTVYVDLFDSIINSSYIGIFTEKTKYPLFTSNNIQDISTLKDYQLNFADKVDGIVSASFSINPFMVNVNNIPILFDSAEGTSFKVSNEELTLDYIGSIATTEKLYNYKDFMCKLKLHFVPVNGKLFKTKDEFTKFNNFVEYVNNGIYGQETNLPNFRIVLDSIDVSVRGETYINPADIVHAICNIISISPDDFDSKEDYEYITKQKFDCKDNSFSFTSDRFPAYDLGAIFYR